MAVNPYDPSQPTGTSQVELSAELRALKGVNVAHKAKLDTLEDQVVPILGTTAFGTSVVETTSSAGLLDLLGGEAAGIEVFKQSTVSEILSLLGIATSVLTVEQSAGKTCITFNGGTKLQIVNMSVSSGGSDFTWFKPFTTVVYGAIPGLNSTAGQGCSVDNITTAGARADHGNLSNQDMSIWAVGI